MPMLPARRRPPRGPSGGAQPGPVAGRYVPKLPRSPAWSRAAGVLDDNRAVGETRDERAEALQGAVGRRAAAHPRRSPRSRLSGPQVHGSSRRRTGASDRRERPA
jgi:hypothetical protein